MFFWYLSEQLPGKTQYLVQRQYQPAYEHQEPYVKGILLQSI